MKNRKYSVFITLYREISERNMFQNKTQKVNLHKQIRKEKNFFDKFSVRQQYINM